MRIVAGGILAMLLGTVAGATSVFAVLMCAQLSAHHNLVEFWGHLTALILGAPAGAILGAVLGTWLAARWAGGKRHGREAYLAFIGFLVLATAAGIGYAWWGETYGITDLTGGL